MVLGDMGHKSVLPCSDTAPNIKGRDKDYVVIGGTTEDLLTQGFQQVGASFPVFLHPETKDEYALARREIKTGDKHTDFSFEFTPDITLEEDALRRDFTINALYFDGENRKVLDPTERGIQDCADKILRHVSDSFLEDPLRIMRCARLAAQLGFKVAPETVNLIQHMVRMDMLAHLSRERIDNEFARAMSERYDSALFLSYLHEWGALEVLYPELERLTECTENPRYHWAGTTWGHMLTALDSAHYQSARIKTALAYHDIYKPIAYKQKKELGRHVAHDCTDALDYLQGYLSQRKFDGRTKTLCKLAVKYHMRMKMLFHGISAKKWVDMIASITSGFRTDYLWQLEDLLEVCKADDLSDKPQDCFGAFKSVGGKDRWATMHKCALQTFEVCSTIQARTIDGYEDMEPDQLKAELRRLRTSAVKSQVDFFAS